MDTNNKDFQSMMASLMQNAQKMQENMRNAYQEMAEKNKDTVVQGKAGGDMVVAEVSLKMQLVDLKLKPQIFEEKQDVIAELIVSAVNQGLYAAQQAVKQEMTEISKKVGMPSDLPFSLAEKG
ncbi:MAG: hypothetical protein BGO43_15590 [Gammaproteobacteria bacterium 39-13]|nr:YbaB/EbfC family nucleoid-associated protein [Gammaproteobacteria bacterium]OJV87831.1 MAG: hypothetical protein BGO43_15590 [Gammaproteobacteria bacterium 39-13]